MKRIYISKDLKGIKKTFEVKYLVNLINENDCAKLNTYTLNFANGAFEEAYEDVVYRALKNGMFKRSIYYNGNPTDLERICWFFANLFNASITDTERFLRTMAHYGKYQGRMLFYDRFGLNTLEIY